MSGKNPAKDTDHVNEEFLWYFTKDRLRIYSFIFSLLRNSADSEEVFQQCSITLWKKFPDYDKTRDFCAWACGIAFRKVQNFRRLAVNRKMVFDDRLIRTLADEHIASIHEDRQRLDLLDECVASLAEKDRELIVMTYRDQYAVGEVAKKMDRATQTIYNRMNIIRARLLSCINRKMAARTTTLPGKQ